MYSWTASNSKQFSSWLRSALSKGVLKYLEDETLLLHGKAALLVVSMWKMITSMTDQNKNIPLIKHSVLTFCTNADLLEEDYGNISAKNYKEPKILELNLMYFNRKCVKFETKFVFLLKNNSGFQPSLKLTIRQVDDCHHITEHRRVIETVKCFSLLMSPLIYRI